MNNIQKINDIKYLIMEHYSDKEPLSENQKASKQCFFNYCNDIRKDLNKLEKIKLIVEDYEKYKLKPYKPADDYIRLIKEVIENDK